MMEQVTSGGRPARCLGLPAVKSERHAGRRPTWHSAPSVSPALRAPPLPTGAERHAVLRQEAWLVHRSMNASGNQPSQANIYVGGSQLSGLCGCQPSRTNRAGCRGRWGGWCSGIKEEPAGRGTAAEAFTPVASAYTNLRKQCLHLPQCPQLCGHGSARASGTSSSAANSPEHSNRRQQ